MEPIRAKGGMVGSNLPPDEHHHAAMIQAIAQGHDRAAFDDLFRYFAPRVKAWMLRTGCNTAAAEDIAQEAMLNVWRKARLFDPSRSTTATWIFTIARNLRIDAIRRERHPSTLLQDSPEETDPADLPDRILDHARRDSRIRAALSQLPAGQQALIRQAFFEDKSHTAIEKELGIPLGTVKSRLRLAIARLRTNLEDPT